MEEPGPAPSAAGRSGKVFDVDMLLRLRQPAVHVPMHASPDGALLAISVQSRRRPDVHAGPRGVGRRGLPREAAGSQVVVVDVANEAAWEPFGVAETSWGGQWSPDGRMLAAYVTRDEEPFLALWRRDDGAVLLFEQAPVRPFFGFEVPRWTPDNRAIVVKLAPAGERPAEEGESSPGSERTPGVRVFSFDPAEDKAAGARLPGWSARYVCDLGVIDVASGAARRLARAWPLTGWKVAPDGSAVAVLKDVGADQTLQQFYFDLVIVPLDGGEPRIVARRVPQSYGICFNWSPDGKGIAYSTRERQQASRLFVVPADGSGAPVELTEPGVDLGLEQDYEAPRWSRDGGRIFCLAEDGVCEFAAGGSSRRTLRHPPEREIVSWVQPPSGAELWQPQGEEALLVLTRHRQTKDTGVLRIDLAGGASSLLFEVAARWHGWTFGVETRQDGSGYYLLLEAADHPVEVWHAGSRAARPKRLFALNPDLADVALGTSRLIEYRALDGEVRRAALQLPPGYQDGERLPVVVEVYAGLPGSEARHVFGGSEALCHWQLLAARGYAVLWPDIPPLPAGDLLRRLPGLVLPAVDTLIELGIADPNRLGVMGHSFGGYCTLALITQTPRFRAAVAAAGMVDLISFYGTLTEDGDSQFVGWVESGQGALGGSLWEKRAAYVESSPLFYLDRVETPLLLVCGTRNAVEPAQAGEAFSALRRLGKRVAARIYEGEDHWSGEWSERNFRNLCAAVLDWLDRALQQPVEVPG